MILVVGGLGFIGSHTARALLDLGETCVLTQHRSTSIPDFLKEELGTRIFVEQLDIADPAALLAIGRRHPITGIVYLLGASGFGSLGPIEDLRVSTNGLLAALQATQEWQVPRISIASTIGVYAGVQEYPWREDMPLPMLAIHMIPTFKKCAELIGSQVAALAGFEVVHLRIAAIWGPLGRAESLFIPTPRLVHAAVKGEAPDLTSLRPPAYAEEGLDLCYVKDCGRAIALLQTTKQRHHQTYNVGTGYATKNKAVVAAIKRVIPEAPIELPEGYNPQGPGQDVYLDITRLREDTGFAPAYDVEQGVADYIGWLRAGHAR